MYGQPNYYNNMYQPQMRYQPIQQTQPQTMQTMDFNKPSGLQGKMVDSIETVKSMDIPLDRKYKFFCSCGSDQQL